MKREDFYFLSSDGKTNIHGVIHIPDGEIKGVLQITHGMVDYIDRYSDFAASLAAQGILVAGHDHLGHGESICTKDDYGYFEEIDGNRTVLNDVLKMTHIIKERYPDKPYVLLGHSMGSFYARQYLFDFGEELDGAIIMGTACMPPFMVMGGKILAKTIALFKGWRYRSQLLNNIAIGAYNKSFEPARTGADWISKDEKIVDSYVADERCTFVFTLNGYYSMFNGLTRLNKKSNLLKMPKELPVLVVSGAADPVGDFSAGVTKVAESFKNAGMKNVTVKLYPDDRHEILNETDKETVYADIAAWLDNVFNK